MLAIDSAIRMTPTRLLLQIHDELIYECNQSDARNVLILIKNCMEKVASLRVPLPVSLKMGKSWANLDPVNLDDPTAFDRQSQVSQPTPAVNESHDIDLPENDEEDLFSDI